MSNLTPEQRKEQRLEEREILELLFSDYDARYHDVFIQKYEKYIENKAMENYMKNRNIK